MAPKHLKLPAGKSGSNLQAPDGAPSGSTNAEHPAFCLRYLNNFRECDAEDHAALATTFCKLGQMTWAQIMQADRHGSGSEKISRDQIRVPLSYPFAEGQDFVLAFRYRGKLPILCLRTGAVLRVLHIDRTHVAY